MPEITQVEIAKRLIDDEINWEEALELIKSISQKKPWHTQEWKEKRDKLIKDYCEVCGSTEPPMVLQHTWQPPSIKALFNSVKQTKEWEQWQEDHPIIIDQDKLEKDTDACPVCSSVAIYYRKGTNDWRGRVCRHVFAAPIKIVSRGKISEEIWGKKIESFNAFKEHYNVGKLVVLKSIENHFRYMSLADTKTYCKRCAFVSDMTNFKLCQVCKKNYHKPGYDKCYQCHQNSLVAV